MAKLRTLSGRDLLRIFDHFGFASVSQNGSHIKLRRLLADGTRQTLIIALHEEVDKGTVRAIFRQALAYITDADLRPFFFTRD